MLRCRGCCRKKQGIDCEMQFESGGIELAEEDISKLFEKMACKMEWGVLVAPVQRVSGGFIHRMYRVETTSGTYAVKLLNPEVMKREGVFANYEKAERLERLLQEHDIPLVPALAREGKKMHCIDGRYFYAFDWVVGRSLPSEEIRAVHCEIVGAILARIHKIEQIEKPVEIEPLCVDWDMHIAMAVERCPEIVRVLQENRALLYAYQEEANGAFRKIPPFQCICHGDMDSKNVFWVDGEAKLIDLECLDYWSPYMEMFNLALCWSGCEHFEIDYELLRVFVRSYMQEYGAVQLDWDALYATNINMFVWLDYNVKRALRIESEDEEECKLGIEQVQYAMKRMVQYAAEKERILAAFRSA